MVYDMTERNGGKSKKLISTVSTSGLGFSFENNVQAYFVFLMMTNSLVPKMPNCTIEKLFFQQYENFQTDDCTALVKDEYGNSRKILMQIKRGQSAKICSNDFKKTIDDAWHDFCNPRFDSVNDRIFFITGELNSCDSHLLTILDVHIHIDDFAGTFWTKYNKNNFFSKTAREKFEKVVEHITDANNKTRPSDEDIFAFFKIFYIIKSDLHDKKINRGGINLSLVCSRLKMIVDGERFKEPPQAIWDGLNRFVSEHGNSGEINRGNDDLVELFALQKTVKRQDVSIINKNDVHNNSNISTDYAKELALLSLVGSFDENNVNDVEIVTKIIDGPFVKFQSKLQKMLIDEENLKFANGVWKLAHERKDIMKKFANYVFDNHVSAFGDAYMKVVGEINPALDLPADKRFMSNIFGKRRAFSKALRSGIADGMAMIANNETWFVNCTIINRMAFATIRDILQDNSNINLWASIYDQMTPIAEAHPEWFLKILEATMKLEKNPLVVLAKDYDCNSLFSTDYLSGLRWALVDLAWDVSYCARACSLLVKLASMEQAAMPDDRNSCISAIVGIMLPWRPQTMVPAQTRYKIIENALVDDPEIGWKILRELLPDKTTSQISHQLPRWRENVVSQDWDKNITNQDAWDQYNEYSKLFVKNAKKISQMIDVLDDINYLTRPGLNAFLKKLAKWSEKNLLENERSIIWDKLLEVIEHNESRGGQAQRALSSEIIAQLRGISERFAPTDALKKHARLFNHHDYELINHDDYRGGKQKLIEDCKRAVNDLLTDGGLERVIELVDYVQHPDRVGEALGGTSDNGLDSAVLPTYLDDGYEKHQDFSQAFIASRFYGIDDSDRWQWVENLDKSKWTNKEVSEFAISLPFTENTWKLIERQTKEVQKLYWKSVRDTRPESLQKYLPKVVDSLLKVSRPLAAINYIHCTLYGYETNKMDFSDIDVVQCKRALSASIRSKELDDEHRYFIQSIAYEITEVIKFVQKNVTYPDEEMFYIEWYYLPLLCRYSVRPKALIYTLANNPQTFCCFLNLMFKSGNDTKAETKKLSDETRDNLFKILFTNDLKIMPGMDESGEFDSKKFTIWLREVKSLSEASGRWPSAQSVIGRYLINAPADPKGFFIHKTIARELDKDENDEMRAGYIIGIANEYGSGTVDPTGKDKLELMGCWNAYADKADEAGFMRLTVALRNIASDFGNDVRRIKNKEDVFALDD